MREKKNFSSSDLEGQDATKHNYRSKQQMPAVGGLREEEERSPMRRPDEAATTNAASKQASSRRVK